MDSIGLVYPTIYEIWPGLWARWDVPAASVRLTRSPYRLRSPNCFTTETQVVRKNRSAGVSPASEPRQLLLGQHDLCRLEAGDTFFLTTTEGTEISQRHQGCPCISVYSVSLLKIAADADRP